MFLPFVLDLLLTGKQFSLQILIEVDHLQDVPSPYLQIKGVNKEIVIAAGLKLKLEGSYTTKVVSKCHNHVASVFLMLFGNCILTVIPWHRVICKLLWRDYQYSKEVQVEFVPSRLQGCKNQLILYKLRYYFIAIDK